MNFTAPRTSLGSSLNKVKLRRLREWKKAEANHAVKREGAKRIIRHFQSTDELQGHAALWCSSGVVSNVILHQIRLAGIGFNPHPLLQQHLASFWILAGLC